MCCLLWVNEAVTLHLKDSIISKLESNIFSWEASKIDISPKDVSSRCCAAYDARCHSTAVRASLGTAPSPPLLVVMSALGLEIQTHFGEQHLILILNLILSWNKNFVMGKQNITEH